MSNSRLQELRAEREDENVEPFEVAEPVHCPGCGTDNAPLGALGSVRHFNCRWCGLWYTQEDE